MSVKYYVVGDSSHCPDYSALGYLRTWHKSIDKAVTTMHKLNRLHLEFCACNGYSVTNSKDAYVKDDKVYKRNKTIQLLREVKS